MAHPSTAIGSVTPATSRGEVTLLLERWSGGDAEAFDQLTPLIYDDLRRIARQRLRREARCQTIETSDLVNEMWLRFQRSGIVPVTHRGHFLAFASRLTRQILTDHARARLRLKRGEGAQVGAVHDSEYQSDPHLEELVNINAALDRLDAQYSRKARVFEMRYYGGFEVMETAEVLKISKNTVVRDYEFACAWLRRELGACARE